MSNLVTVKCRHPRPTYAPFRLSYERHESICGRRGLAPHVLDLGTRRSWVVKFTIWPIYTQENAVNSR